MTLWKNIFRPGIAKGLKKIARAGRRHGLRRDRRGSMTAMLGVSIPAVIICGGWAVDQAYVSYRYQALEQAAASAAMAGHTQLASYYQAGGTYSTSSMSSINSAVSTILSALLPSGRYGSVIPTTASNSTSNVQIGTWNPATQSFTATTTSPNAVRATALATVANGNPVNTIFGGLVGRPTVDMTVTAVSSYGNGLSGAGGFNTIILNDLSMSFSSEMANQRAADNAILNCISSGTNGNGSVGLTSFDGDPYIWNPAGVSGFPTQVAYHALLPYTPYSSSAYTGTLVKATATNVATMATYINGTFNYCGTTHGPPCSGSNLAAGLYSAIQQLQAAGIANTSSNIIVITDGVPNAEIRTYTAADGMGVTPSSTVNSNYSWSGCTVLCSDANLWTAAQAWAAYAGSLGINISTVYYSGDTNGSSNITSYSQKLGSLVTGQGIALVAPSASSLSASFATFCSSMGTAVKLMNKS